MSTATLQETLRLPPQEMDRLYKEAYRAYQAEDYEASSTLFRRLVLLNPFDPSYWMGLAASLQLLSSFEEALRAYALVALLDPENPSPHLHASECYHDLGDEKEMRKALKLAFDLSSGELKEEIRRRMR